jgi:hypothetical protein
VGAFDGGFVGTGVGLGVGGDVGLEVGGFVGFGVGGGFVGGNVGGFVGAFDGGLGDAVTALVGAGVSTAVGLFEGGYVGPGDLNIVSASNISFRSKLSLWGHTFARSSLPSHSATPYQTLSHGLEGTGLRPLACITSHKLLGYLPRILPPFNPPPIAK